MRQALRSSLVLAVVIAAYACSGSFTSGPNGPFVPGAGGATGSTTGDGGADAGDGGDGGDGGLACSSTPLPVGVNVFDNCGNAAAPVPGSIIQSSCADVDIQFTSASSDCRGQVIGPNDGFDGGCFGLSLTNCTSTTLPGLITCHNGLSLCTIRVCNLDAGTCPQ